MLSFLSWMLWLVLLYTNSRGKNYKEMMKKYIFAIFGLPNIFLIINLRHLMSQFAWMLFGCVVMLTIWLILLPPPHPGIQPIPSQALYITWIFIIKTSIKLWLKSYVLNTQYASGQLFVEQILHDSMWYFYSHCSDDDISLVRTSLVYVQSVG